MGTKKVKVVANSSSKQEAEENDLTLEEKIYNIFDEAQKSVGVHRVLLRKLINIVENDNGALREESMKIILRGCVDRVMFVSKKEPAVERIVKFYCNFMINSSTTNETFVKGMEHMLMRSLGQDKTVRFRAVQIIATILTDMPSDADLDENLWHSLGTIITPRLRDRAPNVRLWAIQAVSRLQNPEDEDNYLIAELLRLMCTDISTDIRVAAVETICICSQSLPGVVERIRDIKTEVRCAAIDALRKAKVGVRHLNTALRAQIVQYGLNDRENKVKYSARALIFSWIDDLDSNVPKLFHYLNLHSNRVDANQAEKQCQHVAFAIMHELDKAEGSSIVTVSKELRRCARDSIPNWEGGTIDSLTPADLLWAVGRCEYAAQCFNTGSSMELNDALIPDTLKVCDMLLSAHGSSKHASQIGRLIIDSRDESSNNYILQTSPQRQITVKYLLRMAVLKLNDAVHDVDGKIRLALVCNHMLQDAYLPSSLVLPVLTTLMATGERDEVLIATARLCSSLYEQIKAICIAEDENEDEVSQTATDVEGTEDDPEKLLLKSEEYMTATVVRAMEIAAWVFQQTLSVGDITKLNPSVITLVNGMTPMIWESLQQCDKDLRCLAIKCLGLLATASAAGMAPISDINSSNSSNSSGEDQEIDESDAMPWKSMGLQERDILLSSAMMVEEEKEIRCTAISGLCDILCVHNMVTGMRKKEEDDERMINSSGVMTPTQEHKEQVRLLLIDLIGTSTASSNSSDDSNETIRCTALEAACKLLLSGAIHCPILFAYLCQAFYTPASMFGDSAVTATALNDDNDLLISSAPLTGTQAHLQQSLSLFFNLYATATLSVNAATTTPIHVTHDCSSSSSSSSSGKEERDVPLVLLVREFQRRQQTVVSSISYLLAAVNNNSDDCSSSSSNSSSTGSSIVHVCKCLSEFVTSFEDAWSDFERDCRKYKLKNSSGAYITAADILDDYIPVDLLSGANTRNQYKELLITSSNGSSDSSSSDSCSGSGSSSSSMKDELYRLKENQSQLYNFSSVVNGFITASCIQLVLSATIDNTRTMSAKRMKAITKGVAKVIDNLGSSWMDSAIWDTSSTNMTSVTICNACNCILSICALDKTSDSTFKNLRKYAEQITKKINKSSNSNSNSNSSSLCDNVGGLTLSAAAPELLELIATASSQARVHDDYSEEEVEEDDDEAANIELREVEDTDMNVNATTDVDGEKLISELESMAIEERGGGKTKKTRTTATKTSKKTAKNEEADKENNSNTKSTKATKATTATKAKVTKAKATKTTKTKKDDDEDDDEEEQIEVSGSSSSSRSRSARGASRAAAEKMRLATVSVEGSESD